MLVAEAGRHESSASATSSPSSRLLFGVGLLWLVVVLLGRRWGKGWEISWEGVWGGSACERLNRRR